MSTTLSLFNSISDLVREGRRPDRHERGSFQQDLLQTRLPPTQTDLRGLPRVPPGRYRGHPAERVQWGHQRGIQGHG